jgi:hypothetical protein
MDWEIVITSAEQINRRCTTFRQQGRWPRADLSLQMGEYLFDDDLVFDAGYDLDSIAAFPSGIDVDIENTLQPLRPAHGRHAVRPAFSLAAHQSFCSCCPCLAWLASPLNDGTGHYSLLLLCLF